MSEKGSVDLALLAAMVLASTLVFVGAVAQANKKTLAVIALLNERGSVDPRREPERRPLDWPSAEGVSLNDEGPWLPLPLPLDYSPRGAGAEERPWFLCHLLAKAAALSSSVWRDFCA